MVAQRQQLRMSDRDAATVGFCLWLVVSAAVSGAAAGADLGSGSKSTLGDEACLYESQTACQAAEASGCVWCNLPRRCYSAARSLELGEFCTQKQSKIFVDVPTCDEIADHETCSRELKCRWCRSEKVDDGCFDEIEAFRLPNQIFVCSLVSLASSSTTVLGVGL